MARYSGKIGCAVFKFVRLVPCALQVVEKDWCVSSFGDGQASALQSYVREVGLPFCDKAHDWARKYGQKCVIGDF
ncbi:hypothetical protein CERSUDRAFT_87044 [Gelatoporia subvermispora B]|uniref:Uncharacterized protein n=1 Tax=Ceriporiopsis subvermispora (strain B) TaxID=914234 RepID=M2R455_CERS8|nr:hypothetical protein CERSUDRAFT_87044 [Gelatoporia subvermispora B]